MIFLTQQKKQKLQSQQLQILKFKTINQDLQRNLQRKASFQQQYIQTHQFHQQPFKEHMKPQQSSYAIYVGKKSLTLNNLSTHQYAQAVQLYTILTQCTRIFLRKNALSPQQTIAQYLSQCNKGQHVLLKSFSSFNKSSMNRICFLHNFVKIFQLENHQRNGLDYYQLFRLLCSDFPRDIVVKSVNLALQNLEDSIQANMAKIINSRKFINALYLNFIHTDYLQTLYNQVFEGKNQSISIYVLAEWAYQKQKNMHKIHQKPIFSAIIQALLNQMRKKGLFNQMSSNHNFPSSMKQTQSRKVIFLNQKNCLDYIRSQCNGNTGSNKNFKKPKKSQKDSQQQNQSLTQKQSFKINENSQGHYKIFYQEFLRQLINQVEYHKWIKQYLQMFQNSIIWAVETFKILSTKQTGDNIQPLNQKKMKKK